MAAWRASTWTPEGSLIEPASKDELERLLGSRVAFDAPLSRYTSLRVGGPADALVQPETRSEAVAALELCRRLALPILVLGNGFNTLVRDGGVRGVVVRLQRLRGLEVHDATRVHAEAGVTHSAITRFCAERGLAGLEFGVGIPGTVGGWMRMNAGTLEREMADAVAQVEYWTEGMTLATDASRLAWHYRRLDLPDDAVVLGASFALERGDPSAVAASMKAHMDRRRDTQPIDQLSCGSVFKNPQGDHAGRLIEAAGLKGSVAGGARISEVHANFIVNAGGATASDVLTLIERAHAAVRDRGTELETEVQIVGVQS